MPNDVNIVVEVDSATAICANHIAEIENVSNNIEKISEVTDYAVNVGIVANSIDNVNAVGNNIADVTKVSSDTNLANIENVSDNMTNVNNVAVNMPDVKTVANNTTTLVSNMPSMVTIAGDLEDEDSNIKTVASNISNVNKVGTIDGDVTKVADIDSYIPRVAVMDDEISTIAQTSNIEKIAIVGADLGSQSSKIITVANDIKTGGTNYTNTVAANISNVNAVGGNISNVNAVANNATNINAVNSNKTNIDVCATNITSITNAPTAASNAAQQAGIATAQANIATQQAALAKQYAEETHGASDVTVSNLRALPAINNYEYPQTDEDGLNDLIEAYRSTFDLSKFTVVGSPTITTDGIVSGFVGNGFIRTADTINFGSTFELYLKINTGTIISSNKNIIATNSVQGIIIITGNGKLRIQLGDGTQWVSEVLTASGTVNSNTDYLIKLTYDGTEYALYVLENGTWTKQISYTSATQFLPSGYAINIGGSRSGTGEFEGSVDLKYFALKVDGVPVFSGNQTGIDTIKPDDYTVVGTPTISADGVASGFTANDYIKKSISISANSNYIIESRITIDTVNSLTIPMDIADASNLIFSLRVDTSNSRMTLIYKTSSGTSSIVTANNSIAAGETYNYKLIVNGSNVILDWNGMIYNTISNFDNIAATLVTLGVNRAYGYAFDGSIDLNSFKIYVNDDLVYQPCLKIPYTLSKTGSKIVDSAYRDRVNDMYEQFGYANYFTLKEDGIKEPSYTKVGNPTLVDGVASGFSASDYFTTPLTFEGAWTLSTVFNTSQMQQNKYYPLLHFNSHNHLWIINSESIGSNIRFFVNDKQDSSLAAALYFFETTGNLFNNNTNYSLSISFNGEQTYKAKLTNLDNNVTITDTQQASSNSGKIIKGQTWKVGATLYDGFCGNIYLNSLKIKYDDAIIAERLLANFTVPQGNLYGMIGQQTLRKSTVSGINRSFLYSDRTLLLTGSCTSGVEVTLPKPFINSNYMLSVPYSAKSATAFTPTQTGDWFAIGEGEL